MSWALPGARLPASLEAVWELRHRGDHATAFEAYLQLASRWGVSPASSVDSLWEKLRAGGKSAADSADFLLLEASFLRQRLQIDEAQERVRAVDRCLERTASGPVFQAAFQGGLNALFLADYSSAFDRFITARRLSRNEREFHYAFLNAVLCLECLGYDYSPFLAEFGATYEPLKHQAWTRPIRHQVEALKLRDCYLRGDLSELGRLGASHGGGVQGAYFLAWLQELPTLKLSFSAPRDGLLAEPQGHLVPFRMRTLKGLLISEDLRAPIRTPDGTERLYLWTWAWLIDPDPSRLDKILQFCRAFGPRIRGTMTPKDYLLVELSTRWLSLLAGVSDETVSQSLVDLRKPEGTRPVLLDYERLLLDYLSARREGNATVAADTWLVLREHPAHAVAAFALPKLARALEKGSAEKPWHRLVESLLERTRPPERLSDGVAIDLGACRLSVWKGGALQRELRSQSLCRLSAAVTRESAKPVAEVLYLCFGIPGYDEAIHGPKLANLLHRANQLLEPHLRFSRRNSVVYADGPGPIVVRGDNAHTRPLLARAGEFPLAWGIRGSPSLQEESPSKRVVPSGDWLDRQEMEALLGVSRSSVLRRLDGWKKQKLVSIKGVGKATRYRLAPSLQKSLMARFQGAHV